MMCRWHESERRSKTWKINSLQIGLAASARYWICHHNLLLEKSFEFIWNVMQSPVLECDANDLPSSATFNSNSILRVFRKDNKTACSRQAKMASWNKNFVEGTAVADEWRKFDAIRPPLVILSVELYPISDTATSHDDASQSMGVKINFLLLSSPLLMALKFRRQMTSYDHSDLLCSLCWCNYDISNRFVWAFALNIPFLQHNLPSLRAFLRFNPEK